MQLPDSPYKPTLVSSTNAFHQHTSPHKGTHAPGTARPFLYWVGSKRSILPELETRLPKHYNRYHEPFLGSGALYLAARPSRACLSDINARLIGTFKAVRDDLKRVIKELKTHKERHCKEYYLEARARFCAEQEAANLAGLFIYLNKTCFHGAYRINKHGHFSVSYGYRKNPAICDEENLYNVSDALQGVCLKAIGFERKAAAKNDFFYFDPPYDQSKVIYSSKGFHAPEQAALASLCQQIDRKAGYFMLSNSDTPFVRQLYRGFHIERVVARRSFSPHTDKRGKIAELLIRNYT